MINKLKEEGIDKNELGREGFLKRTWEWREEYGRTIVEQLKKIGSSCDWDRERFTMDEGCSEAVLEVFTRLYEKGYIYKGSRIINWCPVCHTSISDACLLYTSCFMDRDDTVNAGFCLGTADHVSFIQMHIGGFNIQQLSGMLSAPSIMWISSSCTFIRDAALWSLSLIHI